MPGPGASLCPLGRTTPSAHPARRTHKGPYQRGQDAQVQGCELPSGGPTQVGPDILALSERPCGRAEKGQRRVGGCVDTCPRCACATRRTPHGPYQRAQTSPRNTATVGAGVCPKPARHKSQSKAFLPADSRRPRGYTRLARPKRPMPPPPPVTSLATNRVQPYRRVTPPRNGARLSTAEDTRWSIPGGAGHGPLRTLSQLPGEIEGSNRGQWTGRPRGSSYPIEMRRGAHRDGDGEEPIEMGTRLRPVTASTG